MKTCTSPSIKRGSRAAKWIATALFFSGVLALQSGQAVAEVFKCKVGGSTVYQGLPCDGKMEKKSGDTIASGAPVSGVGGNPQSKPGSNYARPDDVPVSQPSGAAKLTLAQIYTAMIAAAAEQRKASADHDKAIKAIAKTDTAALERAHNMYHARMDAAESTKNELSKELRRRCPGGSNLSANSQQCKP